MLLRNITTLNQVDELRKIIKAIHFIASVGVANSMVMLCDLIGLFSDLFVVDAVQSHGALVKGTVRVDTLESVKVKLGDGRGSKHQEGFLVLSKTGYLGDEQVTKSVGLHDFIDRLIQTLSR